MPDRVLLPLQANMASKSDMRYGASAEGADFESTDQAHFGSQLRARIWTRYKLPLSHLSLYFILHNVSPKLGEITLFCNHVFPGSRKQKLFDSTFSIIFDMQPPSLTLTGYSTQVKLEYNKIESSGFYLLGNMSQIVQQLGPFAKGFFTTFMESRKKDI